MAITLVRALMLIRHPKPYCTNLLAFPPNIKTDYITGVNAATDVLLYA